MNKIKPNIQIITFFVIALALAGLSSCYRKCKDKDLTFCEMPPTGEKYFKTYKEGSYWIYYNKDSTKKDSVYVSNYKSVIEREKMVDCIEWEERTFELHSEYLNKCWSSYNPIFEGRYGNFCPCDESRFQLECVSTLPEDIRFYISSKMGVDSLFSSRPIKKIGIFFLRGDTNLVYNEVTIYDNRYCFAPEIGLIQYVSYSNQDTFYIHKYHVE